jgi:agmatinase
LKDLSQLLTLPGNGVFTVHTAKEKKEKILAKAFSTSDIQLAQKKWLKSLSKIDSKKVHLIGIPSDNGGGIQRGANWGPLALREKLYEDMNFNDLGDVRVIPHLLHDKYLNSSTIIECQKALYGKRNKLPVSPLSIAELSLKILYKKYPDIKIFGLGGDHSVSYPLVKAWLESRKNLSKAAILHFDAHTDLLDKRMGIDICFGTWTYKILDLIKTRNHLIQVGIRSSGKTKSFWKKSLGINQFWSQEINTSGVEAIYKKIKSQFSKIGVEEIYITFDIDALDEKYASATGTPEPNGLSPATCCSLIRLIGKDFKITGADLVEVAPYVWPENILPFDQKNSLEIAGDLAKVLLGQLQP